MTGLASNLGFTIPLCAIVAVVLVDYLTVLAQERRQDKLGGKLDAAKSERVGLQRDPLPGGRAHRSQIFDDGCWDVDWSGFGIAGVPRPMGVKR